jgi:hypothetical protein
MQQQSEVEGQCVVVAVLHSDKALFQDVFEFLISNSDAVPSSLTLCSDDFVSRLKRAKVQLNRGVCRLVRGPVKRPDRAISKVYRAYTGNVSRLTDLVRCSLYFDSFTNMESFTKAFFGLCNFQKSQEDVASSRNINRQTSWPHHLNLSTTHLPLLEKQLCCDDSIDSLFRIERIRNRFDSSHQLASAYRDFSIKLTIGIEASPQGQYALVPVRKWHDKCLADGSHHRNKSISLFTCEVQMHHTGIQLDDESGAVHDNYVAMRNLVSS